MSNVVGIDYSMSCPAVCVHPKDKAWDYKNCKFWHGSKKNSTSKQFSHYNLSDLNYEINADRFEQIANHVLKFIPKHCQVAIEDYSYGSSGRVFHIAENVGILKLLLWQRGIAFDVYAPTVIKKYASGKGNSNKDKMYEAFCKEHPGIDLITEFGMKKLASPISDIVDAYYICKMHHFILNSTDNLPKSGCMGDS